MELVFNCSFLSFATAVSNPSFIWRIVSLVAIAFILSMAIIYAQIITLVLVPTILLILLAFTNQIDSFKWLKNPALIIGVVAFVTVILLSIKWVNGTSRIDFIVSQRLFVKPRLNYCVGWVRGKYFLI